jgi:hypothetical protein
MMQKKPGLGVMIAVGKEPPRLGAPGQKPEAPKPEPAADDPEAGASEYGEPDDYGDKIMADIEAAGEKHGLDPSQSHAVAADFFRAIADCLSGGQEDHGIAQHDAGGMGFEGSEDQQ